VPRGRTVLKWVGAGALVLAAIQLVPYGRDHARPSGGRAIAWDSPRTEQLAAGACLDCHSNLTTWPWYSNVAPVSWLVQHDVDEGRATLNLSTGSGELDELVEAIQEGSMPPWQYTLAHARARLSGQEQQDLIHGLEATFAAARGGEGDEGG
jgi:mono/diheme cytochrome c family protein